MTALLVQGAAALAVVAALVYARHLLRRPRPAAAAALEVQERCALGRESGVAVVRWRGREVLVGYAPSGVSLLLEGAAEREVAP